MPVYLIHFDRPLCHARHYLGYTTDLASRVAAHRNGSGSKLLRALGVAGIGWAVVRVWADGDRALERRLKKRKNAGRMCPACGTLKRGGKGCGKATRTGQSSLGSGTSG